MSKRDVMIELQIFCAWGASSLHSMIHTRRLGAIMADYAKRERAEAECFNLCAGRLAKTLGLASMVCDRPQQLKEAA